MNGNSKWQLKQDERWFIVKWVCNRREYASKDWYGSLCGFSSFVDKIFEAYIQYSFRRCNFFFKYKRCVLYPLGIGGMLHNMLTFGKVKVFVWILFLFQTFYGLLLIGIGQILSLSLKVNLVTVDLVIIVDQLFSLLWPNKYFLPI